MLVSPISIRYSFFGCHAIDALHDCTKLSKSHLRKNKGNCQIFTFERIEKAYGRVYGNIEIDPAVRQKHDLLQEWLLPMGEVPASAMERVEGEWHLWLEFHEIFQEATAFDYALVRKVVRDLRTLWRFSITGGVTLEEAQAAVQEMVWPTLAFDEGAFISLLVGKTQDWPVLDLVSVSLFSVAACDMASLRRHHLSEPCMAQLLPEVRQRGGQQVLVLPTGRWVENMGRLLVAQGELKHGGFREIAKYLEVSENTLRKCKSGEQLPPYGGGVWNAVMALAQRGRLTAGCATELLMQLEFAHLMTKIWQHAIRHGLSEDEVLAVYARIPSYHSYLGQFAVVPGEADPCSSPDTRC